MVCFTKRFVVFILSLLVYSGLQAQSQQERKYIREGNKKYAEQKFPDAEVNYKKAMEDQKKSLKARFNLGDAMYKQGRYQEAADIFSDLAASEKNKTDLSKIYHNLGNSLLMDKKIPESVQAYKKALLNNPDDMQTKHNLAFAQRLLQQPPPQQTKNQNKQQNQNQNQQQNKKDQSGKNNNKDNQDKNKQQNQNQQNQQQNGSKQGMSKEDANRILQALQNDEKQTRDKMNKQQFAAKRVLTDKNW